MRDVIRWAIRNTPGLNTVMIALLVLGAVSMLTMRRESFPEFDLDIIICTVPYPGASPDEVEEGICLKIEEAVRSIDGIEKQTSTASEGLGSVTLELETDVPDAQRVLNEVRSEIDRISTFPELAEDPEVRQLTMRRRSITVGVLGPDDDGPAARLRIREVAEAVRDDLLRLDAVSQAAIIGAPPYQIDVEIPEATLRKHGLSLADVAATVRAQNLDLPAGRIDTRAQEVLVRGKDKRDVGAQIAEIPLIARENGAVLTVGELGRVKDEFVDRAFTSRVDGRPGLAIGIERTSREDLLSLVATVRDYAAKTAVPDGFELRVWGDESVDVRDRMDLLIENGLQGLLLVFLVLAIFLELRLAFWVGLGIPIAILGAAVIMLVTGQTLNMISMFAFLMALGIVVDDAIVIGENIYTHREMGKDPKTAALEGTLEVLPSVTTSVVTTIVAFTPLLFVSGVMGKFIAVMPAAVIAMLVLSLGESLLLLPAHLAHHGTVFDAAMRHLLFPLRPLGWLLQKIAALAARGVAALIERVYLPLLARALRAPGLTLSVMVAVLLATGGLVKSGRVPFIVFPKLDSKVIVARATFPDGTPEATTDVATRRLEAAILAVNEPFARDGRPLVRLVHRTVGEVTIERLGGANQSTSGSNVGAVSVELVNTEARSVTSDDIVQLWREETGEVAGVESLTFGSQNPGPGGTPIEFKLLAPSDRFDDLLTATERTKEHISAYSGVFDVQDDHRPGKWEMQLTVEPRAQAMGVPLSELARTVRASFHGEEVMRLQRGRHEVKLMVRYPEEERRSLAQLEEIRVRTGDGAERPLKELAKIELARGASEIHRLDQLRSITISADVDEARANARQIVEDLETRFLPDLLAEHPDVSVRFEGQQEQTTDSVRSMARGFAAALAVMFALLTFRFRSYAQPLIILAVVPFGFVGAIFGHLVMDLPITMFSLFGLVALTGVVVNDSIVLIDFINHRVRDGVPLTTALADAGRRRFRPVLLTSVTTIAGLLPILSERSFQAQILIPMATSLCFGLLFATVIVLGLVPCLYRIYAAMPLARPDGGGEGLATVRP